MIHECRLKVKVSDSVLPAGFIWTTASISISDVESYYNNEPIHTGKGHKNKPDAGTILITKSGVRYAIDTRYSEFSKIYKQFWSDLLTKPEL